MSSRSLSWATVFGKSLAGKFGVYIGRQVVKQSLDLSRMDYMAKSIGLMGCAEVLGELVRNPDASSDCLVKSFGAYIAENFSRSRSQWCQDMFVGFITGNKSNGRYLEIGGADGITHSNTLALRDWLGWTGVLIEPDPLQYAELRKNRSKGDITINAAITGSPNSRELRFVQAGQLSSIVGFHEQDMHGEVRQKLLEENGSLSVRAITLESVFTEFGPFDYFSLDVEGYEVPILESYAFWKQAQSPKVVTIECNLRSDDEQSVIRALTGGGYRQLFCEQKWLTRGDLWFQKD